MERVVLVSVARPPSEIGNLWHARFQHFQGQRQNLGVLGGYMAADIVEHYSVEQLRAEFDGIYKEAQDKYMLSSADLQGGLTQEELRIKQGAKQRTVFNFTVSLFGLRKFRGLIEMIYGKQEFAEQFDALEGGVYTKMADLLPATQAEYLKVLNAFTAMSYEEMGSSSGLVKNTHYAKINYGGKDAIELSMRACYSRYRVHCKNIQLRPLFSGEPAFLHAVKDSNALLAARHTGSAIAAPGGTFVFDMDELRKMGVDDFKD